MSSTKTINAIKSQKCRCCTNPSSKFLELDSANKSCGTAKTYKDVLYEITNIKVFITHINFVKTVYKCPKIFCIIRSQKTTRNL